MLINFSEIEVFTAASLESEKPKKCCFLGNLARTATVAILY
jgi:hypothetical protein